MIYTVIMKHIIPKCNSLLLERVLQYVVKTSIGFLPQQSYNNESNISILNLTQHMCQRNKFSAGDVSGIIIMLSLIPCKLFLGFSLSYDNCQFFYRHFQTFTPLFVKGTVLLSTENILHFLIQCGKQQIYLHILVAKMCTYICILFA